MNTTNRALKPTTEVSTRESWRVEISHHVHTGGHWSAGAVPYPGDGCWTGERCLYAGSSEADCRAAVEVFLASPEAAKVVARLGAFLAWRDKMSMRCRN